MPKRMLICTDLDRTLLPNGSQPESPGARETFARLVMNPDVTLAYVSGRHRALVEDAIREYQLPMPDWVIGDVGTTIYRVSADEWLLSDEWEQDIAPDWRGLSANDIRLMIIDLPSLRLQEEAKQNHFKLSYYLPLQTDIDSLKKGMERRLTKLNVVASIIYSIDEAASIGLLDVLPARATKLHAVEFLMQQLGFDYTNTVFAGDSGNDLSVLVGTVPSILVANASCEVVEQAQKLAREQGTMAAFYLAQGDFLGMNGNYSAGIVEGVAHYHPEIKAWIK
jgi:sucrose-6-phosphatase